MRLLVALLLCLALPVQGAAAWASPVDPCPMGDMMMAEDAMPDRASADASGTHGESAAMADCCNDALTFMETGQPCKTGMDCGAPVASVPPAGLSVTDANRAPERFALAATAPPPPGRSTIWRPPSHR